MTLASTQPLTEISIWNLPGDKGRPALKADTLSASYESIVQKMWDYRRFTTLWASTAFYRDSLVFIFTSVFRLTLNYYYYYSYWYSNYYYFHVVLVLVLNLSLMYSSPSIIRIIKSWRMRWAGHVARMGGKEGKRPLERPRRRCMNNIRMDLLDLGWGEVDWIGLA
jgi:hypothetical protein